MSLFDTVCPSRTAFVIDAAAAAAYKYNPFHCNEIFCKTHEHTQRPLPCRFVDAMHSVVCFDYAALFVL